METGDTVSTKPLVINFIEEVPPREVTLSPEERANRAEARRLVDQIVKMGRMSAVTDIIGRT